jgi:tRNA(fMet)-specific endonuclease VapC
MNPIVLDTDVVSFLLKGDTRAQIYSPHLHDRQWLISFMTEAELEQWALLANWSSKRIEWLRLFLGRFAIVPSSHDLVLKWALGYRGCATCRATD